MSNTVGFRVNESEKRILKEVSSMYGGNISKMIKTMIFERIEEDYSLKVIKDYEKEKSKGNLELKPINELWAELGI